MSKPSGGNWLLLGGLGFVGRNFLKYLLDNSLASQVRVVDKRHPATASLSPDHKACLSSEAVEFQMSDLSEDGFVDQAFLPPRQGGAWDFVVNCVGETGFGKKLEFYEKGVQASEKCAAAALALGSVKKYIHLSSAYVYKAEKVGAEGVGETGKVDPSNEPAIYNLKAETVGAAVAGSMPFVILRPALVYGPGDSAGVMTRAVIASTFKEEKAKMEFLWDADLKLSTVHVFDVARAIYFCARKAPAGAILNLADKGDTDQGRIASALSSVLGIETSFKGKMMSTAATTMMGLEKIAATVNHNYMLDWMALRKKHGIENTPLSPFIHHSLLQHSPLHVSGAAIEGIGFKYAVPELTADTIREMLALAITQGIYPPLL